LGLESLPLVDLSYCGSRLPIKEWVWLPSLSLIFILSSCDASQPLMAQQEGHHSMWPLYLKLKLQLFINYSVCDILIQQDQNKLKHSLCCLLFFCLSWCLNYYTEYFPLQNKTESYFPFTFILHIIGGQI
jgi:hypothetical protein